MLATISRAGPRTISPVRTGPIWYPRRSGRGRDSADTEAAPLAGQRVGDRAEDQDRDDADRPVDEGDREGLGLGHAVDERQQRHDAALDEADPCRRERHRGEQRRRERHEERAADPEMHVREAKGLDDEEQARRLGRPDEDRKEDQPWERA